MAEFHVTWEIDIEAESRVEAARKALAIQRDPASTATVFDVRDETGVARGVEVDLNVEGT